MAHFSFVKTHLIGDPHGPLLTNLAQHATHAIQEGFAPGCLVVSHTVRSLRRVQSLVAQSLGEKQYRVRFDTVLGMALDRVSSDWTRWGHPADTRLIDRDAQQQVVAMALAHYRVQDLAVDDVLGALRAHKYAEHDPMGPSKHRVPAAMSPLLAWVSDWMQAAHLVDREDVMMAAIRWATDERAAREWWGQYPMVCVDATGGWSPLDRAFWQAVSDRVAGISVAGFSGDASVSLVGLTPMGVADEAVPPPQSWVVVARDTEDECEVVTQHVASLVDAMSPADITVVVPHEAHGLLLKHRLSRQGIASHVPYWPMVSAVGPICPALAYLRLVYHPHDRLSLAACLAHPPFGFTGEDWLVIDGVLTQHRGSWMTVNWEEALSAGHTHDEAVATRAQRIMALLELVDNWQAVVQDNEAVTAGGVLAMIVADTHMTDWMGEWGHDWGEDAPDALGETIEWVTGAQWGVGACLVHFSLTDDQIETQSRGSSVSIVPAALGCEPSRAMVVMGGAATMARMPVVRGFGKETWCLTGVGGWDAMAQWGPVWGTPQVGRGGEGVATPDTMAYRPLWEGLQVGDRVRHPVWGEGVIHEVGGEGRNRFFRIQFHDEVRLMMAKYAGVTRCT